MKLNLPEYPFQIKKENNKSFIFDNLRKKYLVLTPEEWVRQHFVQYIINNKNFPKGLIAIESGLKVCQRNKRSDIVVHDRQGKPLLIVECKAPSVKITQKTFDQIITYNFRYKAKYIVVTNGLQHYCCKADIEEQSYIFMQEIPDYLKL